MHLGFEYVPGTEIWVSPPALAQGTIREPNRVPIIKGPDHPFTKTSLIHGRCYNDPKWEIFSSGQVEDEFGHVYHTLSVKGMDLSDPIVQKLQSGNFVVRINGALEAETFYRCRKASQLLREAGVLTEYVFYQARPTRFPNGKEPEGYTNLQGFRNRLKRDFKESHRTSHGGMIPEFENQYTDDVKMVSEVLTNSTFGVCFRGMMSNVRISEIKDLQEVGILHSFVAKAILSLQMRAPEHFKCWPEIKVLNPFDAADQLKYLQILLPTLMGENLALMTDIGCYHKYLHAGNWTLAGEIVDLDSLRHPSIDISDAVEISIASRIVDYQSTAQGTKEALSEIKNINPAAQAVMALCKSYFTARRDSSTFTPFEQLIEDMSFRRGPRIEEFIEPRILSPNTWVREIMRKCVEVHLDGVGFDEFDDSLITSDLFVTLSRIIENNFKDEFRAIAYTTTNSFLSDAYIEEMYELETKRICNSVIREVINDRGYASRLYDIEISGLADVIRRAQLVKS